MSNSKGRWALIVHGGAKEIEPHEEEANRTGCIEAVNAGAEVLARGGSAVEAVEASIRVLESLPVFNAGTGSVLNNKGEVEMCAALMDGSTLDVGAVGVIKGVKHPVSVARSMLRQDPILLSGEGAFMFARDNHAELCDPADLVTEEQKEAQDTVGAVALDQNGNLAAGTSTGGLSGALKGRMGDSPMPGCGFYADDHIGAVALSGHGEGIARLAAAAQIMGSIERNGPEEAIRKALEQMHRVGGDAGGIAIDRQGRAGWWHNSPDFTVGMLTSETERPQVWLRKDEDIASHG
ncbi:MAG TPA: isoaspartyl peptidase/L-asparaginase family protein [Allosphingosinicella sp.]|uniref:isoaspartyl peptidase/L-asparaginase family protein n=1 Tax=Allosphingosinicella sp. TaxID=2823234 RepID=UPI002EDB3DD8